MPTDEIAHKSMPWCFKIFVLTLNAFFKSMTTPASFWILYSSLISDDNISKGIHMNDPEPY